MLLAINIGNTNIDLGVFDSDELKFSAKIATDYNKTADQYGIEIMSILNFGEVLKSDIDGVIICSVAPRILKILEKMANTVFSSKVINVSSGIKTGLNIKTDNPKLLGSDLVVQGVFANQTKLFPCVIINLETAITFTLIDNAGVLCGYTICPGMEVSMVALKTSCATLPFVSIENTDKAYGKNTQDAMKAGITFGTASMIDGMVENFEQVLGEDLKVLITGDLSCEIAKCSKRNLLVDKDLILKALNMLWQKNS